MGDLGTVDAKYDVAISTACSQLDFIVVDTTETAQRCIEVLRQESLGRASFIMLDKMRPVPPSDSSNQQNAVRLFDCVSVGEPFLASAFYFALGETLVAGSIEEAMNLAYQAKSRCRVVTLDGKLIDPSGTISGGGTRVMRGRMLLATGNQQEPKDQPHPEQIDQLHLLMKQKQADLRQSQDAVFALERRRAELKTKLNACERQLASVRITLEGLPAQLAALEARQRQLQQAQRESSKSKQDAARISEVRHKITERQAALQQIAQEASALRAAQAAVQQEIAAAGGLRYKTHQSQVESQREQLVLMQECCMKAEAQLQAVQLKLASFQKHQPENDAEWQQEIASVDAELVKLTEEALHWSTLKQAHQDVLLAKILPAFCLLFLGSR